MQRPTFSIYIGFDNRETNAYLALRHSILKHANNHNVLITPLVLSNLQKRGLYTRPMSFIQTSEGLIRWDDISDAYMSTEFSNSRFLALHLEKENPCMVSQPMHDWVIFMDCDILARGDIHQIAKELDPEFAVMCVKHNYEPAKLVKMDGQSQQKYARKNWSSVMAFNTAHPANKELTVELINTVPGRDLHRFCWLDDSEIGALSNKWNYLIGEPNQSKEEEPILVHFTNGVPEMEGHEKDEYANEWFEAREEAILCMF